MKRLSWFWRHAFSGAQRVAATISAGIKFPAPALRKQRRRAEATAGNPDRDGLVRFYIFEPANLHPIRLQRGDRNRLDVALQPALFRRPAVIMTQVPSHPTRLLEGLISFIAEQHGVPAEELAGYASHKQTMTDHAHDLPARLARTEPS
ncbi:DUF4158 domain-containing protein [Nitratireductor rhodophyticola]|uniref:DUF4158 domain-containing protein n=1 Tax=Nitratireductor rhodophyticola TaxID=2854036 RepID=UPI003AB412A9